MDQSGPTVDADVRLHAEVPLLAFAGLAHVRIALLVLVLGRTRRVDDRGVHDRAGADLEALRMKIALHVLERRLTEGVAHQQMTELADRRFVRRQFGAQVDAGEAAYRRQVVQRRFSCRVREIEPPLQKVDPQHSFQRYRRTSTVADALEVMRFDHFAQRGPGYHLIHLLQNARRLGRAGVLLQSIAPSRLLYRCRPSAQSSFRRKQCADSMGKLENP